MLPAPLDDNSIVAEFGGEEDVAGSGLFLSSSRWVEGRRGLLLSNGGALPTRLCGAILLTCLCMREENSVRVEHEG